MSVITEERQKGQSLLKCITDYTVIDIETTNRNPLKAKIIELSAIRIRNDEVVDKFSQLVDPQVRISGEVSELTGITNEMVKGKPTLDQVLQTYLDFIGEDVVIGHNIATFDTTIIYDHALSILNKKFSNDMIDTYRMSRRYCGLHLENYKLSTLTDYYGIVNEQAHRALSDCLANFEVYKRLKKTFDSKLVKKVYSSSYSREELQPVFNEKTDTGNEFISASRLSREIFDVGRNNIGISTEITSETATFSFSARAANVGAEGADPFQSKINYLLAKEDITLEDISNFSKWLVGHMRFREKYSYFRDLLILVAGTLKGESPTEEFKSKLNDIINPFQKYLFMPTEKIDIDSQNIVLTGEFDNYTRSELEDILASMGANIKSAVNKKTNYLVIGNTTSSAYKNGNYGRKTEDAMKLIDEGTEIKIILEDDFLKRLGENNE